MRRRLPPLILIAAVALLVAVTATATPPDPAVYLTSVKLALRYHILHILVVAKMVTIDP